MAKTIEAADAIKRLAQQYKQMVAAAEILDEIGSLEQVVSEQKAQAEAARKEADAAKADLAKVKAQCKKAQEDHQAKMDEALATITANNAKLQRDAEIQAAEIVKKAQDEAALLVAQAASEKARMSSEIGGLQKAAGDLKDALVTLSAERDAIIAQTADAQKKLDQFKAKMKALVD